MNHRTLALVLLLLAPLLLAGEAPGAERIVGGQDASIERWPATVALIDRRQQFQFCGGSLITANWVLTAAHCVVDEDGVLTEASVIGVLAGTTDLTVAEPTTEFHLVTNIIPHPRYEPVFSRNDIALLELATPSDMPPIPLYFGAPPVGTVATVVGWGDIDARATFPTTLQEVAVPVVSNEDCNAPRAYNGIIIESQICAGFPEGGKDACAGDSGGPLMAPQDGESRQIGIVSFGIGCARPGKFGVYTRIQSFLTEIEELTNVTPPRPSGIDSPIETLPGTGSGSTPALVAGDGSSGGGASGPLGTVAIVLVTIARKSKRRGKK